jgi:uncharacterized BrkB/YihY/UPF0761 family membrane protein
MLFFQDLTFARLIVYLIRFVIPTAVNVLLINYVSASAIERNDTSIFEGLLLVVSFLCGISLLQDAVKSFWRQRIWKNLLYFLVSTFNVYYFFKMLICCIPSPGAL